VILPAGVSARAEIVGISGECKRPGYRAVVQWIVRHAKPVRWWQLAAFQEETYIEDFISLSGTAEWYSAETAHAAPGPLSRSLCGYIKCLETLRKLAPTKSPVADDYLTFLY